MNFLLKKPNAQSLEDIYYHKVNNYITKEREEKFSKRLEDCLMKKIR